jgi:hypothetical protein
VAVMISSAVSVDPEWLSWKTSGSAVAILNGCAK